MALLPERPPLKERSLVENNLFAICKDDELLTLWDALRVFYANGYVPEDSPLKDYQQKYLHRYEPGLGLVVMEQDLLRAMAVRYAKILKERTGQ